MASVIVKINNKIVKTTTVEYSGSAEQASRTLAFSVPYSPYQHNINCKVALGDKVLAYYGKRRFFKGIVTTLEKTGEAGTMSVTALDYCHYLLRSSGTYKFKNKKAEDIVRVLCKDVGLKIAKVVKTKKILKSEIFEEQTLYDIIQRVYFDSGYNVIIRMSGSQLYIENRGLSSGITLKQDKDIMSTTYSQTSDEMINEVKVYNENNDLVKTIKKDKWIRKYGRYISAFKMDEKGYSGAYDLLCGVKKECQIEAIGNIKAISGTSINIKNDNVGLTGKFFIAEDSHTFESNQHTMSLTLVWKNTIEQGADKAEEDESNEELPSWSTDVQGWYLESSNVIHSSPNCSSSRNKKDLKHDKVANIMSNVITRGKNKGKPKYHACTKCWK